MTGEATRTRDRGVTNGSGNGSGRTRKGSRWLGIALTEAALASTRTKDTYLAAQYRRLRPRRRHG